MASLQYSPKGGTPMKNNLRKYHVIVEAEGAGE
jgi:hypothetical protein